MLRQELALVVAGITLGVPLAIGGARAAQSLLFGVAPAEPVVLGTASVVMIATGLLAGVVPARRAAAVDPAVTLRAEQ